MRSGDGDPNHPREAMKRFIVPTWWRERWAPRPAAADEAWLRDQLKGLGAEADDQEDDDR